jgi:negative regulator of flagellin synthesis FlgM
MAINPINGLYAGPVRSSSHADRLSASNAASLPDKPVGEVDEVRLTPGSMSLRQLETKQQKPPIDEAKVAALRKAIAQGDYQIDSGRLARKLADFESSLSP